LTFDYKPAHLRGALDSGWNIMMYKYFDMIPMESRGQEVIIPILGEKYEQYDAYGSYPTAVKIDPASVLSLTELSSAIGICWYVDNGFPNCAYRRQGGDWMHFVTEESGYRDGFGASLYSDVFGHSGFYISGPRGAAYHAYDYYYFDDDGELNLLFCGTYLDTVGDFNGDGKNELMYFYHAGRDTDYFYMVGDEIFMFDVTGALMAHFSDWEYAYVDPLSVRSDVRDNDQYIPESMGGSAFHVVYQRDGVEYGAQVRFTQDVMIVTED
jgi:hypothetical protein